MFRNDVVRAISFVCGLLVCGLGLSGLKQRLEQIDCRLAVLSARADRLLERAHMTTLRLNDMQRVMTRRQRTLFERECPQCGGRFEEDGPWRTCIDCNRVERLTPDGPLSVKEWIERDDLE